MDGRAAHALLKLRFGPAEELRQRRAVEVVAHLEIRVRRRTCELVPRTHELTVIAAEDAVADERAELHRDRAVVLDGEIGDATSGIEPVGGDDGARRTGRAARLAGPAVRARRFIEREREIGEDLPEKEIRAR